MAVGGVLEERYRDRTGGGERGGVARTPLPWASTCFLIVGCRLRAVGGFCAVLLTSVPVGGGSILFVWRTARRCVEPWRSSLTLSHPALTATQPATSRAKTESPLLCSAAAALCYSHYSILSHWALSRCDKVHCDRANPFYSDDRPNCMSSSLMVQ